MNRQHTADDYRRLIERIRAARPDIALSSDFIVGFPGESDADFEATLQLVRDIGYAQCFSFKYSTRPGTPAAAARKQIAEDVKTARLEVLQKLLLAQQDAFNRCRDRQDPGRCCSKSRRANRARSWAARPICSRCMSKRRAA